MHLQALFRRLDHHSTGFVPAQPVLTAPVPDVAAFVSCILNTSGVSRQPGSDADAGRNPPPHSWEAVKKRRLKLVYCVVDRVIVIAEQPRICACTQ